MKKKVISLMLLAIFGVSMTLAGCGEKGEEPAAAEAEDISSAPDEEEAYDQEEFRVTFPLQQP